MNWIIIIFFCIFSHGWASEIDPMTTAEVFSKSVMIIDAKLEAQEKKFIEQWGDAFLDRNVIYYRISDARILKGPADLFAGQELLYISPFSDFIRDREGNKMRLSVSAKIAGSGKEFILKAEGRYIFFIDGLMKEQFRVIRVEEWNSKNMNELERLLKSEKRRDFISRQQAVMIANQAHTMEYDQKGEIGVELEGDEYIVTFPFAAPGPSGTYLGPDYAAKVWIDARTGEVKKVLGGS